MRGACCLDSADVDRVESFRALGNFERHLISFAELFELNVLELVGVKKEIFFHTFARDETEALVSDAGYCSLIHSCERKAGKISITAC